MDREKEKVNKFSVIIPSFNAAMELINTLDSVYNQTYNNFEVIIVDDGSVDETERVVKEYFKCKHQSKYQYIYQHNQKQGAARNNGLKFATGDIILFLDAGDLWHANLLRNLDIEFTKNRNLDVCFFGYEHLDQKGFQQYIYLPKRNYRNSVDSNSFDRYDVPMSPCFHASKREFLFENDISFLEGVFFEDIDYILKIVTYLNTVESIQYIGYSYIIDEISTVRGGVASKNLDVIKSIDSLMEIYQTYYPQNIEIIEFIAIRYLFIDASLRTFNTDSSKDEKRDVLIIIRNYMDKNFKSFNDNKYLKKLPSHKKVIYKLLLNKNYFIINCIVRLKYRRIGRR